MERSRCQNCDWEGPDSELGRPIEETPHLLERVSPGEPMPTGECPVCGALCQPVEGEPVTKPLPRDELAILLDNECYPAAADKIRGGADARRVLNELRPFIPQHNDDKSRNAVGTFQEICAGDLEVA